MRAFESIRNERGIGLVIAVLVLLVLAMMAAAMMTAVNVDTKISGHDVRESKALNAAEAGIGEAMSEIKSGYGPDANSANAAKKVVQVFLTTPGSVPVLGTDSTGLATMQPSGSWLNFTTASRSPNTLTIEFKTDPTRTQIYKYDASLAQPLNTATGNPVYVITSTGTSGTDRRKIVTEVMMNSIVSSIHGALACNQNVSWSGNETICGYNHRSDTPATTGQNGRSGAGGCNEAANKWETGSTNLPGVWSTGAIGSPGGPVNGTPPSSPNQSGFYAGPWEALSMTQAQFVALAGPAKSVATPNPKGIIYLDNNATMGDQSGAFSYNGGSGEGLLYCDGDLTLNGNFQFRGLVYVEGNLSINSWSWILGGLVVRGKTTLNLHSNGTVLYSKDAINQYIGQYSGSFVTLSWHEVQ